jgi:excisionase family DNA binding protein
MLLTVGEIAKELKVSVRTVRKWIKEGKIKRLPIPGHIRIEEEELQRFMKGGQG